MFIINNKGVNSFKRNFDYEEDNYDRLKSTGNINSKIKGFTNKTSIKNIKFDYEEDTYEPEKTK